MAEVDAALAAKVEVVATPRVQFAGFPANVGEKGVQFELGTAGKLVKFTCELSEDEMTLEGTVSVHERGRAGHLPKGCLLVWGGVLEQSQGGALTPRCPPFFNEMLSQHC